MVISLSVIMKSVTGDFSKNELKSSVFVYSVDVCDAESTLWLKTVSSSEITAASTEHKERITESILEVVFLWKAVAALVVVVLVVVVVVVVLNPSSNSDVNKSLVIVGMIKVIILLVSVDTTVVVIVKIEIALA